MVDKQTSKRKHYYNHKLLNCKNIYILKIESTYDFILFGTFLCHKISNERRIVVQLKQENICFQCENNTKIHLSLVFSRAVLLLLCRTNKRKLEKFVHVDLPLCTQKYFSVVRMYSLCLFHFIFHTQLRLGIIRHALHVPLPGTI